MKALIFAAGLGNRLRPLTDTTPKALLPVGGKPMLEHVILKLRNAGFDDITINIHHLGQQIIDFLEAHNNFGIQIHISDEREYLLDTGGGIKYAASFLNGKEPFLVHNVDIFSNVDLQELYRKHTESGALATLLVSDRKTSRYLLFDKENKLCGWKNRDTGEVKSYYPYFNPEQYTAYAFSGIHVISPSLFRYMDGHWTGKFSITDFYLQTCKEARIGGYIAQNLHLIDIGKPETLAQAEKLFE